MLRAENAALRSRDGSGAVDLDSLAVRAFLHAPFPAIVHADDGEILALSDGFVSSTGYSRAEIARIEDWVKKAYGDRHEEVAARIRRRFEEGGVLHEVETTVQAADGRMLHWLCSSSPPERLPDGRAFAVVMAADVTGREAVEEALRQSEEQGRLALDAAELGVWEHDFQTGLVRLDDRARAAYGFEEAVVPITDVVARIHPDDAPRIGAAIAEALSPGGQGRYGVQYRVIHPDGSVAWLDVRAYVRTVEEGGERRPVSGSGTVHDVTRRVEVEQGLRESEMQLRLFLDSAGEAFYAVDREGTTLLCNAAFVSMLGFEKEQDAVGRKLHDVIHHSHPDGSPYPKATCPIYRTAQTGTAAHVTDEVFYRLDGTAFPVEYRSFPVWRDGALQGAICTFVDVTARREAEKALRDSEARAQLALDVARMGTWEWDPVLDVVTADARCREILGLDPTAALSLPGLIPSIYAEDVDRVQQALGEAVLPDGSGEFAEEFRFVRPDGVIHSVISRGQTRFEGEGGSRRAVQVLGTVLDVTERVQAERALRESEARFRQMADSIPQLAWMADAEGWIFWYNERWYDYTGKTAEEMEGWGWQSVHDPAVLPSVMERWTASIQTGVPFDMEFPLRGADGTFRPFLTRVAPLRDADGTIVRWFGTNTDIHDVRQTQQALSRQARLLDLSHDAIFVWHPDNGITYWNRGAEDLYGYTREEAIGQRSRDLLHVAYPDGAEAFEVDFREIGEWIGMLDHTARDGRRISVESRLQTVAREDGGVDILETTRDVTARLAAEARLREVNGQLKALNEQLEARVSDRTRELQEANHTLGVRNRELQDFAYVASHDLQEPLRKIRAFADMLIADHGSALGEEPRHFLSRIQDAAARMSRLIADLLAFSRVTTKGDPFSQVDLNATLATALQDLDVRMEETGGQVEVTGVLPTIEADPVQMHQLLLNLVGNALKYRREDVPPHVVVSATVARGRVELTVSDNGIGFEERYAERIFAPFQRLHTRGEYEGTGMGLAIVRRIVERHGGSVAATSVPGQGSSFSVVLPTEPRGATLQT